MKNSHFTVRRSPDSVRSQAGFGLVEAMMVVAIMGVLSALAVPSFASFIARLRVDAAVQSFSNSVHFARNEALSRNRSVLMCRIAVNPNPSALPACDASVQSAAQKSYASNDWASGWVVYTPVSTSNTALVSSDQVLQVVDAPHWAVSIMLPSGVAFVRFTPLGTLVNSNPKSTADLAVRVSHDAYLSSHDALRCVSSAGRMIKPFTGGCV